MKDESMQLFYTVFYLQKRNIDQFIIKKSFVSKLNFFILITCQR